MVSLPKLLVLWVVGFIIFSVVDLLWIGVVASNVYRAEVGDLLILGEGMSATRTVAALITWLLITLALVFFAAPHRSLTFASALARGAFLGLIIYGVYDLTNLAVLGGWTLRVTIFDILWGVTVCALTNAVLYLISSRIYSGNRGPL